MSFGVDPRNPLEYARIGYFLVPGVNYNREPISGVGGDYDFQIETIWRVGKAPNGDPPITGNEGDQWILTKKTGGYAQGNQNPTWQKFISGGVPQLFTLSDTANDTTEPSGPGDTPPNNIQLYSSDGSVVVTTDAANNRIDFTVEGGQAVSEFTTDVGGPVTDDNGVVHFTGASTTYTNGSVAHTLRTEVQGTNHALFVGRGSNTPASQLNAATDGQILIGSTGADPVFAAPTNGNNITWTGGAGSTRADVTGTINHAVLLGNSSGSITPLTLPVNGYAVLRATSAPSTTDPQWITSSNSFSATFENFNGSYVSQAGRWIRFGNMLMVQINMDWTGNSATGDMRITNMPFVSGAALSHFPAIAITSNVALPASTVQVYADADGNNSLVLKIMGLIDGGNPLPVQMSASGTMSVTTLYFTVSV